MPHNFTNWRKEGRNVNKYKNFLYKEFATYELQGENTSYHVPLIASNNMVSLNGVSATYSDSLDWFGNDTNPSTSVLRSEVIRDLFTNCLWYLFDDIEIYNIYYAFTGDGADTLRFNLMQYDVDANTGDLSNGQLIGTKINNVIDTTQIKHSRTGWSNSNGVGSSDNDFVSSGGSVQKNTELVSAGKVIVATHFNETDSDGKMTTRFIVKYKVL